MPVISLVKLFFVETVGSVLQFPFWWYTDGLFEAARWCMRGLRYRWDSAGLSLWLKNFFVPMYGQYDLSGRIVSVFMRFVVLIGRVIGLCAEAFAYSVMLFIWMILPVVSFVLFAQSLLRFISQA